MIYQIVISLVLLAVTTLAASAQDSSVLKTDKAKLSYSMGVSTAKNMKRFSEMHALDLDVALIEKGVKDGFAGKEMLLTEKEIQEILAGLQKKLTEKQQAERAEQEKKMKVLGEKNKVESKKFLDENRGKKGVKTNPSGLQYHVIKEGTGKIPKETDRVTVNYKGSLIDGTEFDSSYKRGKPATFPVNGVIKGWTEALQLMKEGSKWQLVIPPQLAYGESGTPGGPIGPNATLIFEVELISIAP